MRVHLPFFIVALLLALIYSLTLAPGISWANQGADSGELISAAYTGGVAHPPGYPLYLGLAWLAQRILPGELALRTNLLSAFFAILTALGLQTWLRRLDVPAPLAALGALGLGLAPAVWGQAVISEVYTLQLFLTVLVLMQAPAGTAFVGRIFWPENWPVSDLLRGLVFGLALGNHATSLFLAPALWFDSTPGKGRPLWRMFVRFGVAGLAALALYATLLLRGAGDAPVNWGRVDSLPRLWWLMSGGSYTASLSVSASILEKIPELLALLAGAGWPLLLLAGLSLLLVRGFEILKRLTLVLLALHLLFGLSYATRDWQVNLLPVFLLASLWLGIGVARLPGLLWPARQGQLRIGLALLTGLSLAWSAWRAWPLVDASRDTRAADFAAVVLNGVAPGSLVFTNEDRDTFALWYYHYSLGQRPDVVILPIGMLKYDWQREVLRVTYPDVVIPDQAEYNFRQAIISANPSRPVCAVFIEPQTAFLCR